MPAPIFHAKGTAGQRVGLLGGTFNPPHAAHRAISIAALNRLGLDQVWWLVTPGNPLKNNASLPSVRERLALAEEVSDHPRIIPTGIEVTLGTVYTVETLRALVRRFPATRFVWLMGADSLRDFHRWKDWQAIARLMPIAVFDREGVTLKAHAGHAAQSMAGWRLPERAARALAGTKAPAWMFLHGPRSGLSSTAIRAARRGPNRHIEEKRA